LARDPIPAADLSDHVATALMRKTILHLVPSLEDTPQTQELLALTGLLIEAGARVVFASEPSRLVPEFQAQGAVWIDLPASTRNPVSMYANARKLTQIIKNEQVTLVHAHSRAPAWSAVTALKGSKVKLVTTWHDVAGKGTASRDLYDSVAAKGDRVVTRNRLAARALLERFPETEPRLRMVPAGADRLDHTKEMVAPERVSTLRMRWGVGPAPRLLVAFAPSGLTDESDGILKAFTRISSHGLRLVLVTGETHGENARVLLGAAAKLGLGDTALLASDWSDPGAALTAAAGVIAPAAAVGGPLAMRAQWLGRAVIARAESAAADLVAVPPEVPEQQRTGWLHDGTIDSLKAAMASLAQQRPSQRDALAYHAEQHARRHNNPAAPLTALAEVYAEILADAG
jgi:hypothetical protein